MDELLEQFPGQPDVQRTQRLLLRRPRHDTVEPAAGRLRNGSTEPVQQNNPVIDYYPGAAKVVDPRGSKFMDAFDEDRFAEIRRNENLYYPFADRPEWELAEFLVTSSLSMAAINCFLSLSLVSYAPLGV